MAHTKVWRTRDGQRIRVCDMEDSHLVNTIRFLERYADTIREFGLSEFHDIEMMVSPDGDGAFVLDREIHKLEDAAPEDLVPGIYQDMVAEAEERGLAVGEAAVKKPQDDERDRAIDEADRGVEGDEYDHD